MDMPKLTQDEYTQSAVNSIVSAYRDSLTTRNGAEKIYTRAEVQAILDAVATNPKHRE